MPELPEVETIKNTLIPHLENKTIDKIEILNDKTIIGDCKAFKENLTGQTFLNITRIGKFLIFHLTDEKVIISHLRMEGKYYFYNSKEEIGKHAKVIFYLNDKTLFVYDDVRSFGFLKLSNEKSYKKDDLLKDIANEPKDVDIENLYQKAKNSNIHIKTFLLDQKNVAGLGNIYVDETLYASNIHPLTKAKYISLDQFKILMLNANKILNKAIQLGGSTIKSYHPSKGVDGRFQNVLKIYNKKNSICPKCGHLIRKIRVNGRGSSFCPNCQKYVSPTYNLAIYGPVGVGKSTVLNMFKECGLNTINCDVIVSNLYQKEDVINDINKMFNLSFEKEVDKNILREKILNDDKAKTKLEKYIHPLVKKEVERFLLKSNKTSNVVEVPLLYKGHLEDMFDFIILIESKNQLSLLNKRNNLTSQSLMSINKNNIIKENDADFIINNDGDLISLKKQVLDIICKLKSYQDHKQ